MSKLILRCAQCGRYTLNNKCVCGGKALDPRPAKYSVEDKYGAYRRIAKKEK